jgi:hypothetical protein
MIIAGVGFGLDTGRPATCYRRKIIDTCKQHSNECICQEQNLSNKRFVSDSNVNGIRDGSYTAVALFVFFCFK